MKERKRNRLEGFDYAQDNLYFVTSCVQDRICCFGTVQNKKMIVNECGLIAQQQWQWLGQQYTYIALHAFVVMPNHIHGIVEINRDLVRNNDTVWDVDSIGTGRDPSLWMDDPSLWIDDPSLRTPLPKIKSLSQLMGAYKTTTSKKIHLLGNTQFAWQRSFHDHIIRDERSYHKISEYIYNNPAKWDEDTLYTL